MADGGDAEAALRALEPAVGREAAAEDVVTPALVRRFAATLGIAAATAPGEEAPPGLHWCLAPDALPAAALGPDGHPGGGLYAPPAALPRRMWAAGSVTVRAPLRIGDSVTRRSRVAAVRLKPGRSGALLFVELAHSLSTAAGPVLDEEQTLVYRAAGGRMAPRPLVPPPDGGWMTSDEVQLFRYSALTFNGHRIHYDLGYATEVEHYPALVVHGPLQATLLWHHAGRQRPVRHLAFRGLAPLFCGEGYRIRRSGEGETEESGWSIVRPDGEATMTMQVSA